ncbi:MAG: N-acetylmuramoyl-L-alanine amidase, partial [Selenomonas sp.]|nr:N-acetylmuramoyl-L-alanine amidase [Selenomonas sp.]
MAIFLFQVLWGIYAAEVQAQKTPAMIDQPIIWTENREQLILQYAQTHYGLSETHIVPQAVVVHWTAGDTWESAYWTFYHEDRGDGTLNVASHFIVDRDGTIYRLTEETALNRHAIGYNWCAIGIENVGGVDGEEDLTQEQLEANVQLIRYLHQKYPTIRYVFGHYQQDIARDSGLYIEH